MEQNPGFKTEIVEENKDASETTPKLPVNNALKQEELVDFIRTEVQNLKQKTPSEIIDFIRFNDVTDYEPIYKEKLNEVATAKPEDYEKLCKSLKYTENRFENYSQGQLLEKLEQIVSLLGKKESNSRKLLLCVDFYVLHQISNNIGLSVEDTKLPCEQMVDAYLRIGKRMLAIYRVIPPGSHYCIEKLSFTKMRNLNEDSFNKLSL